MVKMYVTPCMGVAVAGVASCICFLLINSLRKGRTAEPDKRRKKDDSCACCQKPFLIDRGVDCIDCGAKSCRKSCSRLNQEEEAWRCLFCHQRRTWLKKNKNWFETIGGDTEFSESSTEFSTAKTQSLPSEVENVAINHDLDLAAGGQEEGNSMETVRDIVEKIVEGLVGNVDNTPVNQIYDHPAYKSATSTTNMAHTALKELVERAVEEAKKLPGLRSSESGKEKEQSMSDRSYEDLLATAILNKVIEKFQSEYVDGNSNVLCGEIETGLEKGQEERSSSLEPLSQDEYSSDCSATQTKQHLNHSQPLSLTIEERIEEVTTTYTSDEDLNHEDENGLDFRNTRRVPFPEFGMDIVDPSQDSSDESQEDSIQDLVTPVESWEENWLFQKRKMQARSEPVAMLVPNASAEYRALIGDQDAEDTSDLSECSAQSDEEIEQELRVVISNVVPKPSDSEKEPLKSELTQLENSDTKKDSYFLDYPKKSETILENGNQKEFTEKKTGTSEVENREKSLKLGNKSEFSQKQEKISKRRNKTEKVSTTISSDKERNQNYKEDKNNTKGINNIKDTKAKEISSIQEKTSKNSKVSESNFQKSSQVSENAIEKPYSIDKTCLKVNSLVETTEEIQSLNKKINSKQEIGVMNESLELSENKDGKENSSSKDVSKSKMLMTNGHHKVDGEDGIQQESEYTEHYDTATQKHMDSLTKAYGPMGIDETDHVSPSISKSPPPSIENLRKCREAAAFVKGEQTSHQTYVEERKVNGEVKLATPPRPGTIAEREHKKWENAPPIENNPYSEENIQKRLLERQYSRRSEISGSKTEVPKSTARPLQIVLGTKQLDVKRFGRDYYINDAISPTEERQKKSRSNTGRSASSLSQHSNSGSDFEQQDEIHYSDLKTLSSPEKETSIISRWQKNNEFKDEMNEFQFLDPRKPKSHELSSPTDEVTHCFTSEVIVSSANWENSEVGKLLEKERKNNKNEINARLNNQESTNVLEPILDEKNKKIRRLDLRAFGFENDFRTKNFQTPKSSQQRVVNKLDLKSFGYESGLRRTQSIQLDSRNHNEIRTPKIIRAKSKSNLPQRKETNNQGDDSFDLTKSTEDLNRESFQPRNYFAIRGMFSAKSVPNIADSQHYESSINVNMMRCKYEERNKYTLQKDEAEEERRSQTRDQSKGKVLENSVENLSVQSETERSEEGSSDNFIEKELLLPSVRRLAEAFSKSTERLNPPRVSKSSNKVEKNRPTTPEIHLVETPRQMHSLTARSLSKEFREGLRQIPHKTISHPASHGTVEQKTCENQTNLVENEKKSLIGDISIISPGKLKNNIQFWEQLQRRN